MYMQVAVLCAIEPLIVTGRLLLLSQRYMYFNNLVIILRKRLFVAKKSSVRKRSCLKELIIATFNSSGTVARLNIN